MPCPGRGFHLRVRLSLAFISGSPWSLTSGRRPLHPREFLPERRSSRVPRWSDVLLLLLGWLWPRRGVPLVLWVWLCRWSLLQDCAGAAGWTSAGLQSRTRRLEAGRSSVVRASALPLACCPLPYEWRPLRPSVRGLTPESGPRLRVRASTASKNIAGGQGESPFPPVSARVGTYATQPPRGAAAAEGTRGLAAVAGGES